MQIPYNLVNYCEIDKYASKSYSAVHGVPESLNLGDITKVDTSKLPRIDMISYGFPCQDISLAGKQKGLKLVCGKCNTVHEISEDEVKKILIGQPIFCEKCGEEFDLTRSGLFFQALRIIKDTKPKVAIAENVKNLTSKKFKEQFDIVLDSLEQAGYNNYWQVLNAKDYGIPQNRERVFIVSIRKDIDTGAFKFPEPFELELRLKDLLESEVDEKYYLSEKLIDYVCATGTKNFSYTPEIDLEVARPLTSTMHKMHRAGTDNYVSEEFIKNDNKLDIVDGRPQLNMVGLLGIKGNEQVRRVYDSAGLCPTLNTMQGGNRQPKVLVKENTKKGYTEATEGDTINFEQPNSKTRRGRVGKQVAQTLTNSPAHGVVTVGKINSSQDGKVVSSEGLAPTHTAGHGNTPKVLHDLRIRKLTPLECWRLMDFDDEDFYKAEKVCSNTQLYKQAGNSIVVGVLVAIFNELKKIIFFD